MKLSGTYQLVVYADVLVGNVRTIQKNTELQQLLDLEVNVNAEKTS